MVTLHRYFEETADQHADNIALVYQDQKHSFSNLNKQANKLAHFFCNNGLNMEDKIVLLTERSDVAIILMLACLKGGGAYIPLDVDNSLSYNMGLIQSSKPKFVIVSQDLVKVQLQDMFDKSAIRIMTTSELFDISSNMSNENLSLPIKENNLAYIIYTSATTGKAKGVCIEHKTLLMYTKAIIKLTQKLNGSGSLLHGSIAFDLLNTVIFPTLLAGKALYIGNQSNSLDVLRTYLSTDIEFNFVKLTPSHLEYIVEIVKKHKVLPKIGMFIVGGEKFSIALCKKVQLLFPEARIVNHYGPTETTIGCCIFELESINQLKGYLSVPIGKPLSHVKIVVLENGKQIEEGVGELYVGGQCLARGYLYNRQKTYDNFIELTIHGFKERYYRTGDLVNLHPFKNLEFISRIDEQVKLRGYRIELPAIAAILQEHGDIMQAKAFIVKNNGDDQLGVAVSYNEFKPGEEELKSFIQSFCPNYMIPTRILILEKLPLNNNAKVDVNKLHIMYTEAYLVQKKYKYPKTLTEKMLVKIWSKLFAFEKIGILDDFFVLGGHSLQAAIITNEVNQTLAINAEIKAILEYPILEDYCKFLDTLLNHKLTNELQHKAMEQPPDHHFYHPVSYSQKSLWFLSQFKEAGGGIAYNMPICFEFLGELKTDLLALAINKAISINEILRTTFVERDKQLLQYIYPEYTLPIDIVEVHEDKINDLLNDEISKHFLLNQLPLIRVKLFKVKEDKYIFLVLQHHIISDFYSESKLLSEIAEHYNKLKSKVELEGKKTLQYKDFTLWQEHFINSLEFGEKKRYWINKLHDIRKLNLPYDYDGTNDVNFNGGLVSIEIDPQLSNKLRDLARNNRTTLFNVLLTAYLIIVHRYTHDREIYIGLPVQVRPNSSYENVLGMFVNTIILKHIIDEAEFFHEFLMAVTNDTFEIMTFRDVPFDNISPELNNNHSVSLSSVFQIAFVLENTTFAAPFSLDGVVSKEIYCPQSISKFDMSLRCVEHQTHLECALEFKTQLFKQETIEQILKHFRQLLESIAEYHQQQPIHQLKMLEEKERYQLINEFNDTDQDQYIQNFNFDHFFAETVKNNGNKIAIVDEDMHLTYFELMLKVEEVSQLLYSYVSVRQQQAPILVYMDRSSDLVIALLAILKLNCIYVPLDKTQPNQRLIDIIKEFNEPIILTDTYDTFLRADCSNYTIINLKECNMVPSIPHEPITLKTNETRAAYIMFTSGTTGRPKGVISTVNGLINRILWTIEEYDVTSKLVFLNIAAVGFDISVWEMLFPIFAYGKLVIAKPEGHKNLSYLYKAIETNKINMLHMIPSLLDLFLNTVLHLQISTIKKIVTGGERLPKNLAEKFYQIIEGDLYHAYGPTEASISCTHWNVKDLVHKGKILLGKPIANTQIYIVDLYNNLCPIGVAGELCIAGVGLAASYLNQPKHTQKVFVHNPFHKESKKLSSSTTMYKTGDLARWLPGGEIEFLGRIDEQVKINGHRIEPDEIVTILIRHQLISKAIVRAMMLDNQLSLVAYLIKTQDGRSMGENHLKESIRQHILQYLPEYMVPKLFIFVDFFNVSPNGKLDLGSLPDPRRELNIDINEHSPPTNEIEIKIANIWEACLENKKISIDQNFFTAGGNSLLAIKLLYLLHGAGYTEVSVLDIFGYPTIRSFAQYISDQKTKTIVSKDQAINIKSRKHMVFHKRKKAMQEQVGG